jgi:hypothetical protein
MDGLELFGMAMVNKQLNSGNIGQYAHDPHSWLQQARELDQAAMLIWRAIREDFGNYVTKTCRYDVRPKGIS